MNQEERNIIAYCEICGEPIYEGDPHHENAEGSCLCLTCAQNYRFCDECGKLIHQGDAYRTYDRLYICEDCYDDYFFTCDDCGKIFDNRRVDYTCVNPGTRAERYVCDDCLETYFRCDDCGEWFDIEHTHQDDYGTVVCDHCYDWHEYSTCAQCGRIVSSEDTRYNDETDEDLCEECYEECGCNLIHDYAYKPAPRFFTAPEDKEPPHRYFGVELEVEAPGPDSRGALCENLTDTCHPVYLKHDGSLGSYGVEIVSHPCTLAYHLKSGLWDDVAAECHAFSCESEETGRCGLHIHVSRSAFHDGMEKPPFYNAYKLNILVAKLWQELIAFSRRTAGQLGRWSRCPEIPGISEAVDEETLYVLARDATPNGRYHAVNHMNCGTVEFRLFNGTTDPEDIYRALQLVNDMVDYVTTHTYRDCWNAHWADVTTLPITKD